VEDKGCRGKRKLEADLRHESIRSQLLIRGRGYPEGSYVFRRRDRKPAVVHPSDREPGVSWCCYARVLPMLAARTHFFGTATTGV
jgi:hypothetical protein